ncbi:hypothetical protein VTI74DRAFT_2003 [Chaetomium olivicolor]
MEIDIPTRPENAPSLNKRAGGNGGRFDLCYDEEWLAITRAYNDTLRVQDPETLVVPPDKTRGKTPPAGSIAKHRNWVRRNIVEEGLLAVPRNFDVHAPVEDAAGMDGTWEMPSEHPNAQTAQFAKLLQMENMFALGGMSSSKACDDEDDIFERDA